MRPRWILISAWVTAAALGACAGSSDPEPRRGAPIAAHDELPAPLDNGAAGVPQAFPPGHVAPARACGQKIQSTRRSLVTRVLPDGPRSPEGSLAFTSGVCVYLPPGYAKSGLRYPVLYLLHGGGGDAADAVTFGHVRALMDTRIAVHPRDAAIVVMPDGAIGRWYDSVDRTFRNETYMIDSVVPYIDRHFRTIRTRAGRAIDGVSNGGHGALLLAAKHPKLFGVAGGMSANLDALSLPGLGDPSADSYRQNRSTDLAARLDATDLILDIASRCTSTEPADLCATQVVDRAFIPANRAFVDAIRARPRRRGALSYREIDAAHQWIWWNRTLRDRHLPFVFSHLADPAKVA